MDAQRLYTSSFKSKEARNSSYQLRDRVLYKLRGASDRHGTRSPGQSMLLKLGLCAAACAMVVLVNTTGADVPTTEEEIPGRLKFVELPGIIEVFAQDSKLAYPVAEGETELISDDTVLCITVKSEQTVSAGCDCVVKTVGTDEGYGQYVRLSAAQDVEYMYYGFERVNVEEGQTLKRTDTLGVVAPNTRLYVCVNVLGRPDEVQAHFSVEPDV